MAEVVEIPSWKKGVAELIGTLALIYVGVLVLVGGFGKGATPDLTAIALAHGLTIAVMASATMSISGGQLNPAVTVGLLAARKISVSQAGINIFCQFVGGLLGGYLAYWSLDQVDITGGVPQLGAGVEWGQAILVEGMLTFFLMFVILGTAVDPRFGARIGALAIGFTVALDIMAGGPITGAAMNPARWVGAAIPAMQNAASTAFLKDGLVYFVGPILGAVVAALLYEHVLMDRPRPRPEPQAQLASDPRSTSSNASRSSASPRCSASARTDATDATARRWASFPPPVAPSRPWRPSRSRGAPHRANASPNARAAGSPPAPSGR